MVKRTAARQTTVERLSKTLDFFSYSEQKPELYYEYSAEAELQPQVSTPSEPRRSNPAPAAATSAPAQTPNPTSTAPIAAASATPITHSMPPVPRGTTENIPNLSAAHIVIALVAQKVKKAFDALPKQKSIQELSGGE